LSAPCGAAAKYGGFDPARLFPQLFGFEVKNMGLTATAQWLNDFFSGYDSAILGALHSFAEGLGTVATPLMKLITLLGEKGLLLFILAFLFMCFARTRDLGVCIFGAVCCGALITNIILKDTVARPRPFETVEQFRQWWVFVGSPAEDGFSFPSGHVTAAAAGMTAISLMKGRKFVLPSVIIVVLMGISRNYLMAHYPSDVLFAILIGTASGFIAWFITLFIFKFLHAHEDMPLFSLVLDFDLGGLLPFSLPFLSYDEEEEAVLEEMPARRQPGHARAEPAPGRTGARRSRPGSYRGKHEK